MVDVHQPWVCKAEEGGASGTKLALRLGSPRTAAQKSAVVKDPPVHEHGAHQMVTFKENQSWPQVPCGQEGNHLVLTATPGCQALARPPPAQRIERNLPIASNGHL